MITQTLCELEEVVFDGGVVANNLATNIHVLIRYNITSFKLQIKVCAIDLQRRVYDNRGRVECSDASWPPCAGSVEGMSPVFSRLAWHCA
ncbi:uncharacterized protein Tco_0975401 [Tanacetum coccineum]|uniref:Uncharacterized protein n=1 Tax=Tanacetum coccineum TaxID=301880 RepID=A0ABQ5EE90_9ASTR